MGLDRLKPGPVAAVSAVVRVVPAPAVAPTTEAALRGRRGAAGAAALVASGCSST